MNERGEHKGRFWEKPEVNNTTVTMCSPTMPVTLVNGMNQVK